jgi:hypothetical protein
MQSAVHNQVDLLGLLPPEPSPEAVSQLFGAVNESATLSMAIKACRTAAARLNLAGSRLEGGVSSTVQRHPVGLAVCTMV